MIFVYQSVNMQNKWISIHENYYTHKRNSLIHDCKNSNRILNNKKEQQTLGKEEKNWMSSVFEDIKHTILRC